MDPRVAPFATIFDLNTDLFLNCLAGLTEDEGRRRVSGTGNNVTFIAAHLTDSRHFLAARLDRPLENPLAGYLADAKSLEEIRTWPSLEQIVAAWRAVAPITM